jgi:hypothetical protein
MMAEGIGQPPHQKAMLSGNRMDGGRSGGNGTVKDGVRIIDRQDHAYRTAVESLRAEVAMRGGLIGKPELGAIHC